MSSTTHEIVILGGNFAGLEVVHHLFRQTLPLLKPLPKSPSYHVTLVSPSTQYYFKVGAPRAIVKPNAFPQNLLLSSIPDALAQYGPACQFLQGKAVALEAAQRIVSVETSTGETKPLPYNSLFICTGTTSASPLWSIHADHTITEAAVASMHSQLPKTKSVLIAGAGAVGVETAGEIAHNYPNAKVTLVGSVLPRLKPATQSKAKKLLAEARVEMVDALVKGTEQTAPNSTTVQLGNGEARTVEMFIDARGAHKINSDFLPGAWLDKTGRVNTRDAYFRVKGEDAGNTYVVGDIVAGSDNTAIALGAMVPVATSAFAVDMAASLGQATGESGGLLSMIPGMGSKGVKQVEFKPMKDTILVPVGPTGGVGQAMGWQMPSFIVKKAKSEKFMAELVTPGVTGKKYAQL